MESFQISFIFFLGSCSWHFIHFLTSLIRKCIILFQEQVPCAKESGVRCQKHLKWPLIQSSVIMSCMYMLIQTMHKTRISLFKPWNHSQSSLINKCHASEFNDFKPILHGLENYQLSKNFAMQICLLLIILTWNS